MKGRLIALEGIDGSGKATQTALLEKMLRGSGERVHVVSFPRYEQSLFGAEVRRFLQGDFGTMESIHPKLAALLYAGDRFEYRSQLWEALKAGQVVVCDRYVPSNMVHQACKLPLAEQDQFADFVARLEYSLYALPRPDLVLFLDTPPELSTALLQKRWREAGGAAQPDLQERDGAYQRKVHGCYGRFAARHSWERIVCHQDSRLLSPQEIGEKVARAAKRVLGLRHAR